MALLALIIIGGGLAFLGLMCALNSGGPREEDE